MVWDYFDPEDVTNPDSQLESKARCKFCKSFLTNSKKETGHLKRQRESCMHKHGQLDTTR